MPAKPDPQPPPTETKKRRNPTDVQRDRLTERIRRLNDERDKAVIEAVAELKRNAESELREKITRTSLRIEARFSARTEPLMLMLDALGKNGAGQ